MLVYDVCGNEKMRMKKEDVFEYNGGSWKAYYQDLLDGSFLNEVFFDFESIDKRYFVFEDGGEMFRTKQGDWISVCWRGSQCRIWLEDYQEKIDELNKIFKLD